ncbi:MAG: 4a-hydroxytetrahydrobiopterin dehydratase [Chlamydiia bacterium]|nr:4a-hydroxytetrahydrobiopterin dehydratase [Chlamydiia bacterium]
MEKFSQKQCLPCEVGQPAIKGQRIDEFLAQLDGWSCVDNHHLVKSYKFKDFKQALSFVNDVGHLAEEEGHHPDIFLSWGRVELKIWTHKIDGLSENDFILADKCDAAHVGRFGS